MFNFRKLNFKKALVHVTVVFFGSGAWLGNSSIFVETPIMVASAPEGWRLPSYTDFIAQSGVIGALGYTLYQKFSPWKIKDTRMIYFMYGLGVTCCLASVFFIGTTVQWGQGQQQISLPFYFLTFVFGAFGFTSVSILLPYMGRFLEEYIKSYTLGEALSGLWPSLLGFAQGSGGEISSVKSNLTDVGASNVSEPPKFSVETFFIYVSLIEIAGLISFAFLENSSVCKSEHVAVEITEDGGYLYDTDQKTEDQLAAIVSNKIYALLLCITFIIGFFPLGIAQIVSSYGFEPYGETTYHLARTFTMTSLVVSSIMTILIQTRSILNIVIWTIVSVIMAAFCVVAALTSPNPPLAGTLFGQILIIICGASLQGLPNYIRICILTVMRIQGGKSLAWTGTIIQISTTLGILIGFYIINFSGLIDTNNK